MSRHSCCWIRFTRFVDDRNAFIYLPLTVTILLLMLQVPSPASSKEFYDVVIHSSSNLSHLRYANAVYIYYANQQLLVTKAMFDHL